MPSVASMILRASRDAARAARSAASAASRCAAVVARSGSGDAAASRCAAVVAHSGSGDAAASDTLQLLPSRYIAEPPPWIPFGVPCPVPGKVNFVAEDKDRESDEALWALYERWCKAFNQEHDHDEMSRRFNTFKEAVLSVDQINKAGLPYRTEINEFADGKLEELCSNNAPINWHHKKKQYRS